jgi:hypothetical protein
MSVDRREQILTQLVTILNGVDGFAVVDSVKSVFRNRTEIPPEELCPCAILLDGRESRVSEISPYASGSQRRGTPAVYSLRPQIWIVLRLRKDQLNVGVGEELSLFRTRVLTAMNADDTLAGLLTENGGVDYMGANTDLQSGSSMEGHMMLDCAFYYPLDFSEL